MPAPLPSSALRRSLRERLGAWYRVHRRDLPWRRTRDPYAIWVSEAMLQQTRVESVEGYWARFLRRFPDVAALAEAPEGDVLAAWSGLGYYRRARALHAAAQAIMAVHGGEFPRTRDALRALPGVGPYTAGAVLSIAFDEAEALVDGNVERVFARLFELKGARGSRELTADCWRIAAALVPPARLARGAAATPVTPGEWNQALMELGALVCTPQNPACGVCPLALSCAGRASGRAAALPAPRVAPATIDVALELYVAPAELEPVTGRAARAYWFERRAETGRMAGLWQFPTVEVPPRDDARGEVYLFPRHLEGPPGFALEPLHDLFQLRHAITHHRIRLRVRAADVSGAPPSNWRALTTTETQTVPLSGMARKVLARLDSSREAHLAEGEGQVAEGEGP